MNLIRSLAGLRNVVAMVTLIYHTLKFYWCYLVLRVVAGVSEDFSPCVLSPLF